MAQLVASMSGVVLGGVVEVVGSNLARGKIFTASIGSVDSLYPFVYIYSRHIYTAIDPLNPRVKIVHYDFLHQHNRRCKSTPVWHSVTWSITAQQPC